MVKRAFVAVIALSLLLTSYGTPADTQITGDTQPDGAENTLPTEVDWPEDAVVMMPPGLDTANNEMLDLDTYSVEKPAAEYIETGYNGDCRISKGDAGYYFTNECLMRMFEPESKTVFTVCAKPNCKHEMDVCVANGLLSKWSKQLEMNCKVYYKGYLYFLCYDNENGYMKLYRMAGDGSAREEYMTLYRYDPSAESNKGPEFIISNDTVFYTDRNAEIDCLYKCKLGEDEPAVVYDTGDSNGVIYRLKTYGDFLFFQDGAFLADEDYQGGLYAYNTKTGETKQVMKTMASTYSVVRGRILYSYTGGIYSYDLRTAENVRLLEADAHLLLNNNNYFVLGNLEVYSLSGEYICKLAVKNDNWIAGMDDEYIFAKNYELRDDGTGARDTLLVKPISELDDKPFEEYKCED